MKNEAEKVIGAGESFSGSSEVHKERLCDLAIFILKEMTERATIDPDNQECNEEKQRGDDYCPFLITQDLGNFI